MNQIFVVGSGPIGASISQRYAQAGYVVYCYSRRNNFDSIQNTSGIETVCSFEKEIDADLIFLALPNIEASIECIDLMDINPNAYIIYIGISTDVEAAQFYDYCHQSDLKGHVLQLCSTKDEISKGKAFFAGIDFNCEEASLSILGRIYNLKRGQEASLLALSTLDLFHSMTFEFCKLYCAKGKDSICKMLADAKLERNGRPLDYLLEYHGNNSYLNVLKPIIKRFQDNLDYLFLEFGREILRNNHFFTFSEQLFEAAVFMRLSIKYYGEPYVKCSTVRKEFLQYKNSMHRLNKHNHLLDEYLKVLELAEAKGYGGSDLFSVVEVLSPSNISTNKQMALDAYAEHANSSRLNFFLSHGMDFVCNERAGISLRDMDSGKEIIDLHCNGGVYNLGHCNHQLVEVLTNHLENFDIGNHHLMSFPKAVLSKKLADLMPGDINHISFGVSGGESVELGLKLAKAYTHRKKIICFEGSYHGHTGTSLFLGDQRFFRDFADRPTEYVEVEFGNIEALKKAIDFDCAAIVLELYQASSGMFIPAKSYVREVRELCNHYGAQLIVDEIQTGWGRTGKLWAIEHYDVVPDVMALGKGMSGGIYPMSATCYRSHLKYLYDRDTFAHMSTFGGSDIGCAVVSKVLDISSDPAFLERVNDLSEKMQQYLDSAKQRFPELITNYSQSGLFVGLEYHTNFQGRLVSKLAYENGLLIVFCGLKNNVSQILPPLVISDEQFKSVLKRLDTTFEQSTYFIEQMERISSNPSY